MLEEAMTIHQVAMPVMGLVCTGVDKGCNIDYSVEYARVDI